MRTAFDFTPMFRSSVGFDRLFQMLENAGGQVLDHWPPYDIEKTGEDHYRITMAVAGFSQEELSVTKEPNLLVVKGTKPESDEGSGKYLYRGINNGSFERRFELADHVEVTRASLRNGLLVIDLVRKIPEAMKPRRIEIGTGQPATAERQQIEQKSRAAA